MNAKRTLLVIEDEPAVVRFLRSAMEGPAWRVLQASTGQQGLGLAASENPSIILLDLGLTHGEALETSKTLRQCTSAPVILLTSHGQEKEQATALEAGAHDYLVKPFGIIELTTRIGLALRHMEKQTDEAPIYQYKGLHVDLFAHRIQLHNKEVHLTPTEFEFLAVLIRNAGRLVSQSQLMKAVWGETREVTLDALRVLVHQLRQKIELDPVQPRFLKTEPGLGYRLESHRKTIFKKSSSEILAVLSTQNILH